jgi:KDO2-lipid IV(A) lauroyltransferase
MADSLRQLRRDATQLAIRQIITATAALPIGLQRLIVRSLVRLAARIPMLRWRVQENMCLALGHDVPAQAPRDYFRHVEWFLSNALATFHHGIAATPAVCDVKFDESIRVLDEAVAEGRGVVLASAHWSGHEMVAAIINLRHPITMLVRQAPTSERASRKLKWYNALGAETVLRPDRASSMTDARAYLKVLKAGKLLAITPDLLADPGQGVEISIFGRPARIHRGAFVLAIMAGAPMIRVSGCWQSDSSVVLTFDRAPVFDAGDRDRAIRDSVQEWCRWFEARLNENPENWLFWLDKRWSRFLRATPRAPGAE